MAVLPVLAGASILGGVTQGIFGKSAADQQASAARAASAMQALEAGKARVAAQRAAKEAQGIISDAEAQAADEVRRGAKSARDFVSEFGQEAMGRLEEGFGQGRQDIQAGQQAGIGTLQQLGQQGAFDAMSRQPQNLADFARRGVNLDDDQGYQFRREQGEQAINRAASARGGRLSGRTMKELGRFNSGLASQEFNNAFSRQAGLAGQMDQQGLATLLNQAGRSDAFNRGIGSQIAGMQFGGGQALGGLSVGQGQGLAGLLSGQGSQLAGISSNQGNTLGQLGFSSGVAQANALTGGAQMANQISQQQIAGIGSQVPYAGQGTAAWGNAITGTLGNLTGLAAMAYGRGGGGDTGGGGTSNADFINQNFDSSGWIG